MSTPGIRVIKLGGSLLDWPTLRERLPEFLQSLNPPGPALMLVGGGAVVEAVRHYDQLQSLDQVECHWLCVELMNSTARLLQLLFPDFALIDDSAALDRWISACGRGGGVDQRGGSPASAEQPSPAGPTAIVTPSAFYSRDLHSDALPVGWETTSDSISLLLAHNSGATELVLLKSAAAQPGRLATLVDGSFKHHRPAGLKVSIVNLRDLAASSGFPVGVELD